MEIEIYSETEEEKLKLTVSNDTLTKLPKEMMPSFSKTIFTKGNHSERLFSLGEQDVFHPVSFLRLNSGSRNMNSHATSGSQTFTMTCQ